MEPEPFDLYQYGSPSLDPFGQLPFEFPLLLSPGQDPQWTGLGQAGSTPQHLTYTNDVTNTGFPFAQGQPSLQLQDIDPTQNVPQLALNESSRVHLSPTPAVIDQLPSPEPPNQTHVDDEVISGQGAAHRMNFTSYSASVWNAQYPHIKRLYMVEFKSLDDTMKYMEQTHNFRPSKKMYKDKFNEWGWHKNLPSAMASWMFHKWDQRMREMNKDTSFELGGRIWTSSQVLKRVKRAASQPIDAFSEETTTPLGVIYSTPFTIASRDITPAPGVAVPSSSEIGVSPVMNRRTDRWTPFATPQAPETHQLATRWQNYTRTDIDTLRKEAQELGNQENNVEAERKFREALAGLENLLPPTHYDTNAVAYELAAFYAQHGRMKEADAVLGRLGEQHLEHWGMNHKKTRTHIHRVADLYHSWDRQSDAVAFLCRAFGYYDRLFNPPDRGETNSSAVGSTPVIVRTLPIQPLRIQSAEPTASSQELGGTNEMEAEQPSADIAIKVEETESVSLLDLINQCEKYPESLGEETLHSHSTVINCCRFQQNERILPEALERSAAAFWKIFDSCGTQTKMVLDAAVELAKSHLLSGNDDVAGDMFLRIESEAVESLGPDDHATIAILIDIGKFFQDQQRWHDAYPRFEHALAASLTRNGLESKITKRLEAALDTERYDVSYPSSEAYEQSLRRNGLPFQMNNSFPML